MPEWMHARAEHILAKNPSMPKGEAFAIATQQSHALGKSPKGYGTAEGRATAKAKFDTPKDDKKTANPGHLESPKLAFTTSQYSTPLNPVILSGASYLPPEKRPSLRAPIQTKVGSELFALLDKLAALSEDEQRSLHEAVRRHADFDRRAGGGENVAADMRQNAERIQQLRAKKKIVEPAVDHAANWRSYVQSKTPAASSALKSVAYNAAPYVGAAGGALAAHAILSHLKKPKEKAAASAPTRGNFMMASDIPAFRAPSLTSALQKNSGEEPAKKYAMSTEAMSLFVAELRKQADVSPAVTWSGEVGGRHKQESLIPSFRQPRLDRAIQKEGALTPAGQLSQTQSVGAPKVTAPPGPSIADQTKPRGAKWGLGLPGAMKGSIGGYVGPSLK